MNVLIGIPTHRRPEMLRACLASIAAQQCFDEVSLRIFVADNDPIGHEGMNVVQELSPSLAYPITGRIVSTPGISAVRNEILSEAQREQVELVAMVDDDELVSVNWLTELLAVQRSTDADIVGGPVRPVFRTPPPEVVLRTGVFWRASRASGITYPLTGAGNFIVCVRALERVGWPLFDQEFGLTGGEDGEWFNRLAKLGFRYGWAEQALVEEDVLPERMTISWALRRSYRTRNSLARIALKHRDWGYLFLTSAKALIILAATPLLIPLLLNSAWRPKILVRWFHSAGRVAALFGRHFQEYGGLHAGSVEAN